ncbi:peptide ABC transporter substrate-binding protein [Inquilinus limosus]|uniref:peptide ABC transporter substrate-binding protein n=1 Tax=Inquilinus limosus TaxID=171674 RepID=UPI00040AC39B|nr:peptide ABC transporter substrate-binding protein [Inquilinus limosus]
MHSFSRPLARGLLVAALLAGMSGAAAAETVLNRGNGAEPSTLDPHKIEGNTEANIATDLFEGLMTYGAKGEPVPGAAERYAMSDDGLTYTFTLRADAKWSDGTPVTAADFVFSWQRLVDPKTGSAYAYYLDQVVNAREIRNGQKPPDALGVRAVDDRTFEVKLVAPTPYFVSSLVHQSTYAVSRANLETYGNDFIKPGNLVSNGAYRLAEAVPQGYIKLVKNPQFHDTANVAIDTVMYYPTEDVDSELQRYRAGELDITFDLPSQQIPALKKEIPDQLHIVPFLATYFYAFNMTREPWKSSPELRQALSLAVDRDVLIKNITQADQVPAYSFVPPGTDNFPGWEPEAARMTQAERDARAKDLYAKAGYGPDKPLKLTITYNTSENHKRLAVAIAAMWKQKLGADVTLDNEEWATFQSTRNKKTFPDIARHGWFGDYNDAYTFLQLELGDVGEQSTSGYANPKFDALMAEATKATDPQQRGALLQEAEKVMIADMPILPLYFYTTKHAVSPAVKGWTDNVADFHLSRWLSVDR